MTPSSHAYSTSRSLAIIRKFCSDRVRMNPNMMAKVTVVVARIIQVRFFWNASVRNFLGMK